MTKFFLFDCETGGLSESMSLLTLYGLILDNRLNIVDDIHLKIKPDNGTYKVATRALNINKINLIEHDKNAISRSEAADLFKNVLCKHTINSNRLIPAGHNIDLDVRFVRKHLLPQFSKEHTPTNLWSTYFTHRTLDTAGISRFLQLCGKLPQDLDCSLQSLAEYFGLSYEDAHDEKFDTHLTLQVLKKMIGLINPEILY